MDKDLKNKEKLEGAGFFANQAFLAFLGGLLLVLVGGVVWGHLKEQKSEGLASVEKNRISFSVEDVALEKEEEGLSLEAELEELLAGQKDFLKTGKDLLEPEIDFDLNL